MEKRLALITGGMGGLGETVSTKMADAGYRVAITYSPSNKTKDGSFRKVQIDLVNSELKKQQLRLTYRQGYFARSSVEVKPRK